MYRIEIGIQAIPTFSTEEETLRPTIGTGLVPTATTRLLGMTRVNLDHGDPTFLSFVGNEVVQLGKRPTVQAPFGLFPPDLGAFPNIGEVLKDNRCPWLSALYDAFGEDMICVPVEMSLLARQLLEMSLRVLRSIGLQLSADTEVATVNLFPMLASQKPTLGSDSRAIESQVNPNNFRSFGNSRFRDTDHDMQPELPFAETEVRGGNRVYCILFTEVRYGERDRQFASTTREPDNLSLPVEGIGMHIVADWTELTLWHSNRHEGRDRLPKLLGFSNFLSITYLMFLLPRICIVFASFKRGGAAFFPRSNVGGPMRHLLWIFPTQKKSTIFVNSSTILWISIFIPMSRRIVNR